MQSLGQDREVGVQPEEQDYLFVGCFKSHLQQMSSNLLAQMQAANNKIPYSHAEKNFNLMLERSSTFKKIIDFNFQHNYSIQWQTSKTEFPLSFRLHLFYNTEKYKPYQFW